MEIIKAKYQDEENSWIAITLTDGSTAQESNDGIRRQYTDLFNEWIEGGGIIEEYKTTEELQLDAEIAEAQEAAVVKAAQLAELTVTLVCGKVFYADAASRGDLADAIAIAEEEGLVSTTWKLAEEFEGTRWVEVTLTELKEARKLGLIAKASIVGV